MLVNIFFNDEKDDCDVIDLPELVVRDLDGIMAEFFAWISDKSVDHGYWVIADGEKKHCSYGTEALIGWLQKNYSADARIVEQYAKAIDYDLPEIVL